MVRHQAVCWSLVNTAWGVRWLMMKTSVRWRMMIKPVQEKEKARCGSVSVNWLGLSRDSSPPFPRLSRSIGKWQMT